MHPDYNIARALVEAVLKNEDRTSLLILAADLDEKMALNLDAWRKLREQAYASEDHRRRLNERLAKSLAEAP